MSDTLTQRKKQEKKGTGAEPFAARKKGSFFPNSAMLEDPGHRVDMPEVMRERMEDSLVWISPA